MRIFIRKARLLAGFAAVVMSICVFLPSCTTMEEAEEKRIPMWPSPPDTPRFMYEITLRSNLDIKEATMESKFQDAVTVGEKMPTMEMVKPYDVAAQGGRIIVSDTVTRVVYLFDVPRRAMFYFGRRGEGQLKKPVGVAIDANLNYYITDVSARQVLVFEAIGHFKRKFGGPDDLTRPTDVAVSPDGERIYVVDTGGVASMDHRVVVYDKEGNKVGVIGERGTEEGKFNLPTQAAVAPDGTLYVLDAGNFRIQAFDKDGKFLRAWGGVGPGFGQLARPRGLGVDSEGNVYVTDAAFRNFQIFDKDGQLLLFIGGKGQEDKPGVYFLPAGIAVDETNRVYVVDQYFKKVEVIKRLSDEEGRKLSKKK